MANFETREELLELLLDETQETIYNLIQSYHSKNTDNNVEFCKQAIKDLINLDQKISNNKKLYPKEEFVNV